MSRWLRRAVAVSVVLSTAFIMEWLDGYHVYVGAIFLTPLVVVRWFYQRVKRRPGQTRYAESRSEAGHDVFMGGLYGLLMSAALWCVFAIAEHNTALTDFDRVSVELALSELEGAERWSDAATLAKERIERPLSADWRSALAARIADELCAAALSPSLSLDERQTMMREAEQVCTRFNVRTMALPGVREFIASHEVAAANQKSLVAAERKQRETTLKLAEQESQLTVATSRANASEREFRQLLAAETSRVRTLRMERLGLLIAWGDALASWELREPKYHEALDYAKAHGLDGSPAAQRLRDLKAQLERDRPRRLPNGATARIVRIGQDFAPPGLMLEIGVLDQGRQAIEGLAAKDFAVLVDKRPTPTFWLSEATFSRTPLDLVVLFDKSQSTAGEVNARARVGANALLERLRSHPGQVSLITFADSAEKVGMLDGVVPGGRTALYAALDSAVSELRTSTNRKAVVLFTDGANTLPGRPLEQIILNCQELHIPVHIAAMQSPDLAEAVLSEIATKTGGSMNTAERVGALSATIEKLAKVIETPTYRMMIPVADHESAQRSIVIQIGAAPGVTVTVQTPTITPLASASSATP